MLAQFAWCTSVISPWETSYQREKIIWPTPTTFEKGSKSVQNVDRQILQLAPFDWKREVHLFCQTSCISPVYCVYG